ncbi:hypothetical protein GN109_10790 [Collimonas pratensis]|uniref:hypothetical protein n=1 Tax=Collimonas pratensis TaxID=279113 RepID=UPI00143CF394|nr:hypothetical protein [Collimonas pratensis]NKI69907.1 hypothetical protein [Collimonas pratensis]
MHETRSRLDFARYAAKRRDSLGELNWGLEILKMPTGNSKLVAGLQQIFTNLYIPTTTPALVLKVCIKAAVKYGKPRMENPAFKEY